MYNKGQHVTIADNYSDQCFTIGQEVIVIEHCFAGMICESLDRVVRQVIIDSDVKPIEPNEKL